jgi:VanZ family protein
VRICLQVTAWLLLAAIVALSLVPPWFRPATSGVHSLEHFGIFLATGLAYGLGYPYRYLYQTIGLIAFTATIEIAQLCVPGRHARFSDFIVDALGLGIGILLAFTTASK